MERHRRDFEGEADDDENEADQDTGRRRRPAAYLDPEIWRSMSALALIPDQDRADGIRRLAADLDSGEWRRRWGHLLHLDELDLGYRVLVAR